MKVIPLKQFRKDMKKFQPFVHRAFNERLSLFLSGENHPFLNNHKLNPPWDGCKSINISGDIRLIYKIIGDNCFLVRIGTHPELYK